jgi:hypothetical protein
LSRSTVFARMSCVLGIYVGIRGQIRFSCIIWACNVIKAQKIKHARAHGPSRTSVEICGKPVSPTCCSTHAGTACYFDTNRLLEIKAYVYQR